MTFKIYLTPIDPTEPELILLGWNGVPAQENHFWLGRIDRGEVNF